MIRKYFYVVVSVVGLALAGCSSQQAASVISATQTYDNAVLNFQAAVSAVNGSIALTSKTVGPYCSSAETAGNNLVKLSSGSSTATTALNTVAVALKTYCNAMPTNVQTAVVTLTAAAVAAKKAAGA